MGAMIKEVKVGMRSMMGVRFMEERKVWILPCILHADDLVLCGESEEDLKVMVECFVEMCRRKGLKVNADKGKVIVLGRKEGLECKIHVDGIKCQQFKYLGCVLDESDIVDAKCRTKVASGRKIAGAIRSLVNVKGLQLECARGQHEELLVPVLLYGNEKMIWREKERSRIRTGQMDNLRSFLSITRMGRVPKAQTRESCGVKKKTG